MAVSSVILIAILVTVCVFCICYQTDGIESDNNENSDYKQNNAFVRRDHYIPFYNGPLIPYREDQNSSPLSTIEDIIHVDDKQTNTEITMAPLRPRGSQHGVWFARNEYGGLSHRRSVKPPMVNHFTQTLPNGIDLTMTQTNTKLINSPSKKVLRLSDNYPEYVPEQQPSRFIEQKSRNEIVQEFLEGSRRRPTTTYLEIIDLLRNDKQQIGNKQNYNGVSVKYFKPDVVQNDFSMDHFYQ